MRKEARMMNLFGMFGSVMLAFLLTGCGTGSREIQARLQNKRTDVFTEVKDGEPISKGYADLAVKTSIKAYPEGHFAFEKKPPEGGYPFVLNVNGQGAAWEAEGQKEDTPVYDTNGKRLPEGGKGTRYTLEKKIRLAPGAHRIFLGLPEEKLSSEVTILLKDGTLNLIEFRPVYKKTHRGASGLTRDFAHGISKYEVFLNGQEIR